MWLLGACHKFNNHCVTGAISYPYIHHKHNVQVQSVCLESLLSLNAAADTVDAPAADNAI